jgi:hypothetical protein
MAVKIKAVRNKGFRDFSFVCRELAALTGNDMKTVIDNEVAAILQDTVSKTKVAPLNKIVKDHGNQEWLTYDIAYQGVVPGREAYFAGRAASRRTSSKVAPKLKYNREWRLPNWLWAEIRARRTASLQRKIARAGVGAKHWYEQALQLGYKLSVNPRVRGAQNNRPLAVRTTRRNDADNYAVSGENYSELSTRWAGGAAALQRAVGKRVSLFQRSMKQWAAGKVNLVARKYPDLISLS